jgi:hypothetical protein
VGSCTPSGYRRNGSHHDHLTAMERALVLGAARPWRGQRVACCMVTLIAVVSCGGGGTSDPSFRTFTERSYLADTTWEVREVTDSAGVTHLPYEVAPNQSGETPSQPRPDSSPKLGYDRSGRFSFFFNGDKAMTAAPCSNSDVESVLSSNLSARLAFPDLTDWSVLAYGEPDRKSSALTLRWNGFTARLTLLSEGESNPDRWPPGC